MIKESRNETKSAKNLVRQTFEELQESFEISKNNDKCTKSKTGE